MEIVSLIAGVCSIPASVVSIIMFFKARKEKNECLNIKQQIISSSDTYNIGNIGKFDNKKTF